MSEAEAGSVYSITKTVPEKLGNEDAKEESNPAPSRTSVRKKKKKKIKPKRNICKDLTVVVGSTLIVFVYVCCGGLLFHLTESGMMNERELRLLKWKNDTAVTLATQLRLVTPHEEIWFRTIYQFLDIYHRDLVDIYGSVSQLKSEKEVWTFKNSAFFSVYLMTATGNFNVTPYTTWGKILLVIFSFVGIPLMIMWIILVGEFLASGWIWLFSSRCKCIRRKKVQPKEKTKQMSRTQNGKKIEKKLSEVLIIPAVLSVGMFLVYFILGATIIACTFNDWNLSDGIYIVFLTLSTVGISCFVPSSAKSITSIHLLVKNGYFISYLLIGYLILSFSMCTIYKVTKIKK